MLKAPWTPAQVETLNRWQQNPAVHPFTCGRRSDPGHGWHNEHDLGILVATPDGWICRDCDYTQHWAHSYMLVEYS